MYLVGMLGARAEDLPNVPEDAHLVSSLQHCNSEIEIEGQQCSLCLERALTVEHNASLGQVHSCLQSEEANMKEEFVLASEPLTYARSSSKGEENIEIASLSESSSLGLGGSQNAEVVLPAIHALPLGEQGDSHSITLAPVRVLDEENVTQQIKGDSLCIYCSQLILFTLFDSARKHAVNQIKGCFNGLSNLSNLCPLCFWHLFLMNCFLNHASTI